MRTSKPAVVIVIALAATILACSPPATDKRFEDYLTRLGSALSIAVPEPDFTPLPRPPRSAQLRISLQADKLDALDFLALSGCAVQVTIGKRNSSLGRMARASQRLLLELEYLRLAPACIEQLEQRERRALARQLQSAWSQKREQLPTLIFNATLAGEEYRAFWLASRPAGSYPTVGDSSVVDSLALVNTMAERWLSGDYHADNPAFELALGDIAGGGGGALLSALMRQQDWLHAGDKMLGESIARGPLCGPSLRQRAADILPNVVQRFFIDGIQPHAATLENRRYGLLPAVGKLEDLLHDTLPTSYLGWRQSREELLALVAAAPKRHVQQLQRIQAPCRASPSDLPVRNG